MKAGSDVCCTSANAVEIVDRFPKDRPILFVPDQYLGHYVIRQTGREETLLLWPGCCHAYDDLRKADIEPIRAAYPGTASSPTRSAAARCSTSPTT